MHLITCLDHQFPPKGIHHAVMGLELSVVYVHTF